MNTGEKMNSGGYDHKLGYPKVPIGMSRADALQDPVYMAARDAWGKESHRINMQFKADLEEEFGTREWDRKQQAWDLAWQEGHSGGFGEVLNYYIDYVNAFFLPA